MKEKIKHTTARAKAANEDGSVPFRLTNLQVDRHGEVVVPDGVKLSEFKQNPVVLFGHGFETSVPIGKIVPGSFTVNKDFVDADVIFDENDPFAKMIGDKVRNGFLNTGSIGFMPKTISNDPILPKQTGVTIKEWELLEFSIVPIPSNSGALALREFATECKTLMPEGKQFETYFEDLVKLAPDYDEILHGTIQDNGDFKGLKQFADEAIEKAGRVLSSKNRTLVKNVADEMRGLLTQLDILLEATEPKTPAESEQGNDKDIGALDISEIQKSLEGSKLQNKLNELKTI